MGLVAGQTHTFCILSVFRGAPRAEPTFQLDKQLISPVKNQMGISYHKTAGFFLDYAPMASTKKLRTC